MSTQIIPIPKISIAIRAATMDDLPFMDALQKKTSKAVGYFPTGQFREYIEAGHVLIAEARGNSERGTMNDESGEPSPFKVHRSSFSVQPTPVGYVIAKDRYLKRDELGVVYQLNVIPEARRMLVGAALVKAVFERAAYGCRLFCCWCAQDLPANEFWESLGFVPIAFRAGSAGKKRVHIFWQKRIVEGDVETKWWYPFQTASGAIREDRIVLPIPPGLRWNDAMPVILPEEQLPEKQLPVAGGRLPVKTNKPIQTPKSKIQNEEALIQTGGLRFAAPVESAPLRDAKSKPHREPKPKAKNDPKLVAAARELRDRWLEGVNTDSRMLTAGVEKKYDVCRGAIDVDAGIALPAPGMNRLALPAA